MKKLFVMMLACVPVFADFGSYMQWDVQGAACTTGAGGGFLRGATGVDRSQQTMPYVTFDGSACTATATGTTTQIAFSGTCTQTPSGADIGNVVNITGGANFVPGRYQITANTATKWTLDRNPTNGNAASGMTGAMGGCMTWTEAQAFFRLATPGMTSAGPEWIYLKQSGSPYLLNGAQWTLEGSTAGWGRHRVSGYAATHDDFPLGTNRPVISTNNSAVDGISALNGWLVDSVIIDGAGTPQGRTGLLMSYPWTHAVNVKVVNFAEAGIDVISCCPRTMTVSFSEIANNLGDGVGWASSLYGNWIHDNGGDGAHTASTAVRNLVTNNGGYGVGTSEAPALWAENTFYGNRSDGVLVPNFDNGLVANNLFANNAGWGANFSNFTTFSPAVRANAFWQNVRGNIDGQGLISGYDLALNGDPFTAAAASGSGNWSLNQTIPGASVRGNGWLQFPGLNSRGYLDFGAYQHPDPVASGSNSGGGERSCTFVK